MGGIPRRIGLLVSLLGFTAGLYLLITGSDLLSLHLFPETDFPLGTLLAWLTYLSLAFGIYFAYPQIWYPLTGYERFLKAGWMVLAILSLLWPFISYALSDNWSFAFRGGPGFRGSGRALWMFTYFSMGLGLSLLLWPLLIVLNLFLRPGKKDSL